MANLDLKPLAKLLSSWNELNTDADSSTHVQVSTRSQEDGSRSSQTPSRTDSKRKSQYRSARSINHSQQVGERAQMRTGATGSGHSTDLSSMRQRQSGLGPQANIDRFIIACLPSNTRRNIIHYRVERDKAILDYTMVRTVKEKYERTRPFYSRLLNLRDFHKLTLSKVGSLRLNPFLYLF